jgi:hypothetical protein
MEDLVKLQLELVQVLQLVCKTCGKPIGTAEHYHDSSGYEHKACLRKRAMRKV